MAGARSFGGRHGMGSGLAFLQPLDMEEPMTLHEHVKPLALYSGSKYNDVATVWAACNVRVSKDGDLYLGVLVRLCMARSERHGTGPSRLAPELPL